MKRRQFLYAASSAVLLPALAGRAAAARYTRSPPPDYAFFDGRFRQARRIAAAACAADRLTCVDGDVTPVWSGGLERAMRDRDLVLLGVTTESFHFCLAILAREQAHCELQRSRLDRNLYLWTMSTTPRRLTEQRHA